MSSWRDLTEEELKQLRERHAKDLRQVKGAVSMPPELVVTSPQASKQSAYAVYFRPLPVVAEYSFAPGRKFRFDFAILDPVKIGIEIEGGVWIEGRHVSPTGFIKDLEKYNLAAELGWRVFRYTPATVRGGGAKKQIERVLASL